MNLMVHNDLNLLMLLEMMRKRWRSIKMERKTPTKEEEAKLKDQTAAGDNLGEAKKEAEKRPRREK